MKRITVIAVACALVLLAFSAMASAKRADRPFKGCVCGQVVFTPDSASPSPTGLWTDSSAVGCVSHLGRTVMSSRHPTPTGETITGGTMKLVAANRDEVWIVYGGSAPYPVEGVPSTIVVAVDFTIVGGSGRFAHASGGGKMTGYVAFPGELNLGPWPAYWTWRHATIRY